MKVNPRDLQAYGRTSANDVQKAARVRGGEESSKRAAPTDGSPARVTISEEAKKLAATSGANAPSRPEKVAELKDKISRGDFKVDAQVVARKMIDEIG
jgi:negative regulator of flagellin synthesis FlgM